MKSTKKWFDYNEVAAYYNELMRYIPYDKWAHYIVKMFFLHNGRGNKTADLGCGTCSLDRELSQRGMEITGIDISFQMLSEAMRGAERINHNMINGNITDMPVKNESFNLLVSMYDTVNHLNDNQFRLFASESHRILADSGILMFDFNTKEGLQSFASDDFIRKGNEFTSFWNMKTDENYEFCTLHLSIKNTDGTFKEMKFSERAIESEEILKVMNESGFSEIHLYDFLTEDVMNKMDERGFAVCIKT